MDTLCERCHYRHESRAAAARFIQIQTEHGLKPPFEGMVADAAPKFECKMHEAYGYDPPESRERCDDFWERAPTGAEGVGDG